MRNTIRNTRHVSNLTPKRRKFKESSQEEKHLKKTKQKGNINMQQKNTFVHPDYNWIWERIRGTGTGINQAFWYGYRKKSKNRGVLT